MQYRIAVLIILFLALPTFAAQYHVDADTGDDADTGLSPQHAWKTLDPVNTHGFKPGDQILLKAATHYIGQLAPKGSGTLDAKIILASYGGGPKPRIDGQGQVLDTLLLRNADYWEIRDLEITNHGDTAAPWRTGVHLLSDTYGIMHGIHVTNLYVHDVNGDLNKRREGCGIYFESRGSSQSCFDDLLIESCHVVRTDRNGICQRTTGPTRSTHIIIRANLLEDIGGDGIKLWGSTGGLIEHNIIHGGRMRCTDAAAGIWPFASDNAVIQFNEVSGIQGTNDGQGFDSDYQCKNNIFQYNYSHDNDGGFMLICSPGSSYCQKTVIRYNVSQNDGINSACVFHFGGNSSDTMVYNNIIYVGPKQHLPLLEFTDWSGGDAHRTNFFNNIFYVDGRVEYHWGKSVDNVFDHNIYFGNHDSPPLDPHAITAKPPLVHPGGGGNGIASLSAYQWIPGVTVPRGRAVSDNGDHDFFGNPLPTSGNLCIGLYEVPAK
jgi:Right handed beta helix region